MAKAKAPKAPAAQHKQQQQQPPPRQQQAAAAARAAKAADGGGRSLRLALAAGAAALAIGAALWAAPEEDGAPRARQLSQSEVRARREGLACTNRNPDSDCDYYASIGHCESAPGWMTVMCTASCGDCKLADPAVRCDAKRIGYDPYDIWGPGSVDALFEGLAERFPQYNVTYLSRPPDGPWVAKFHNFVNDEEMDALIDGAGGNLRRSTDQGSFDESGVQAQIESSSRTSRNAWCMGECERNPLIRGVSKRIEQVTGVPEDNFESFQLLRYEPSQEYKRHHDMSSEDNKLLSGPRILTFFLYLSDVEQGGGTQFTDLDPPLTNHPEKGSAILWPSVLNRDPTKLDRLTYHAALPVEKGVKLAANHWIHLRNYKVPNLWGCTGAFS